MYENVEKNKYSPMMRQYLEIKEKNPETLIFYRVGDFYELFFNDAIIGSKELEIVLTSKDGGTEEKVPMAGVPHHAVSNYLNILTSKGYKVAIVEQVENPKETKGIVKREITRIVTPGTIIDEVSLESHTNNFLISLSFHKNHFIFSYIDLSTGEGYLTEIPNNEYLLFAEIIKLNAKEIIVNNEFNIDILKPLQNIYNFTISCENNETAPSYFKGVLVDLNKDEERNYCRILNYVIKTQMRTLVHIQKVVKYDINSYLKIDFSSRRNLELLETLRFQNKKNTLISILDKCSTAMGSRFLKKTILLPLIDHQKLEKRYDVIDLMKKSFLASNDLRKELTEVYDLERLIGRISYENASPKDLLQLRRSLSNLPKITKLLEQIKIGFIYDIKKDLKVYMEVHDIIKKSISLKASHTLKEGNIIEEGFSKELDELRKVSSDKKQYILSLEASEREKTGIKTLKIGYNKVFGYYIEVSKLQSSLVKPEHGYIRRQTLSNAERYSTKELGEQEAYILRAEERKQELETELFFEIRNKIKEYTSCLQFLAKIIAEVDMMLAFTKVSNENKYVRPSLNTENKIEIVQGRHPVLEANLESGYIPNDLHMNSDDLILLITGPNMSGKSTYMRQIALISILAQIGCFVPAKFANLPIFDQIFTRIGASDDIVSGQSTFMVEMTEVNNALLNATQNSLILFDEIGRGTATFDGMALAQAIIEYVHEQLKCKTLFSTHYHELTSLDKTLSHLQNVFVSAEESKGELIFLHKVKKGTVDKSYGINVAKLAKMPMELILRADDILKKLETNTLYDLEKLSFNNYVTPLLYDSKSDMEKEVINEIEKLNIYELNPIEALNILNELKRKLGR